MDEDEDYSFLDVEPQKGIIAGLPVLVVLDPEDGVWFAPANWFVGLFLTPYMMSWFYNDDNPIFVYEGTYLDGLFQWLFMAKEEDDT